MVSQGLLFNNLLTSLEINETNNPLLKQTLLQSTQLVWKVKTKRSLPGSSLFPGRTRPRERQAEMHFPSEQQGYSLMELTGVPVLTRPPPPGHLVERERERQRERVRERGEKGGYLGFLSPQLQKGKKKQGGGRESAVTVIEVESLAPQNMLIHYFQQRAGGRWQ